MMSTPRQQWLAVLVLAAAITLSTAALATFSRPSASALTFALLAAGIAPVALGLGWVVVIADKTLLRRPYAEGNVERMWLDKALAGAAVDAIGYVGAAAIVVAGNDLDAPADVVLTIVAVAIMADVAIRYLNLRKA